MDITRQYIRQFINESQKAKRKFEADNSGYKYAYTTRSRAVDGGWEVADSVEELRDQWDDPETYGAFSTKRVLVLKPATSTDKAMVLSVEPNMGGTIIYPSINAAINGPNGLKALGWEEGETITKITEKELQELLQTKDLNRAKELLRETFVDAQDFGYFDGLYEYVSGPMPKADGATPGKIVVPTENIGLPQKPRDYEYYLNKIKSDKLTLDRVPEKFRTPELCKIAVERDGLNLMSVPEKLRTPELYKIALEEDGWTFRTPELYKIALEEDGQYLKYIPKGFITPELCKIAIENGATLDDIPDEFKEQIKKELNNSN